MTSDRVSVEKTQEPFKQSESWILAQSEDFYIPWPRVLFFTLPMFSLNMHLNSLYKQNNFQPPSMEDKSGESQWLVQ